MTTEETEAILLQILRSKFQIEAPDPEASLMDAYEFDSIDALELMAELEHTHGLVLDQDQKKELYDHRSVRELARYLARCTEG